MKKHVFLSFLISIICLNNTFSQTNNIKITTSLNTKTNELNIQQEIIFHNKSTFDLNEIYLHNWPNAYRDKKTPLAKRFVENYVKSFHFAKEKNRGATSIKSITANYSIVTWEITDESPDILKVNLKNRLKPKDSVLITATYKVKIPKDKYTRYGANTYSFNLKYWYLAPAVFNNKWFTYSNLDMDDLYIDKSDYSISVKIPKNFVLNSDLIASKEIKDSIIEYTLFGKNKLDIALNITQQNDFIEYNSYPVTISTDLNSSKLNNNTIRYSYIHSRFI